jgi:hypothetical protein
MSKSLLMIAGAVFLLGTFLAVTYTGRTEAAADGRLLAHDVFFKLKDSSDGEKKKLVDACKKLLSNHPGTVFFAAGVLVPELNREVNDRDFDVALHIYFQDKASHDQYQDAPRHLQFMKENMANWSKVRVFDSYVEK